MTKKSLKLAAAVAGLSLAAAGLVSCAGGGGEPAADPTSADTQEMTPEFQALVDKAKEEGGLTITWAVFPDAVNTKLIEAFKEGVVDVPVRISFESNIDSLAAKLTEESTAGVKASSDLFLTTSATAATMGSAGANLVEPQDWASFSPWNEGLSEQDGEFLTIAHQFPGFIYNTNAIDEKDLPKSADDVLGLTDYAIASTPYGASFNTLAIGLGGPDALLSYLADFHPAGLINCGEVDRIASGEFDGMWMGCGKSYVDEGVREGAPLGFVSVSDGAVANAVYVAVPKNSEHPASAALFAAWLNTPEAQSIMWEGTAIDNALIEGSHSADYIADLEEEGTEVEMVDVQYVLDNPEYFARDFKSAIVAELKN